MKKNSALYVLSLLALLTLLTIIHRQRLIDTDPNQQYNTYKLHTSGAGEALDAWAFERAFPNDNVPTLPFRKAFEELQYQRQIQSRSASEPWQSIGPSNIGGRTLCLAFHPDDPNIIYAGSASGGLWKTTTMGVGVDAWKPVPTGFPVLGVSSIAIHPSNPDVMYIGTGESYHSFGVTEPGTISRFTRGTYGIGILKTTDGGENWTQSLAFEPTGLIGVQDLAMSTQHPEELYAAATDGLYRTQNGGDSWTKIHNAGPAIDVEIDPENDSIIYLSQGNLNLNSDPNLVGIFKSENKGDSFQELQGNGLLASWSGKAVLSIHPMHPNIIYASIQVGWFNNGPTTPAGLYRSADRGQSWNVVNQTNVAFWQGWYSHDVALNPLDTNALVYVGLDTWRSTDGGQSIRQVSDWTQWPFGKINVGEPEGPDNYVHGDIHAVYYHPTDTSKVFLATDGGIFMSDDGARTFTSLNGGYQTTQFYANFASSVGDPNFAVGGTQDNASYIYDGSPSWLRIIGGDGMSAAINPNNDSILYASAQGLFLARSDNRGDSFTIIQPTLAMNEIVAFSAPYELAPSDPDIVYAGGQFLYASDNRGDSWATTTMQTVDGTNIIANIAVSPKDPLLVYIATAPNPFAGPSSAKIMKSTNGGRTWTTMSGLPQRIAKDIAIDPDNDDIAYVVFSGFGTGHVYKTVNGGDQWLRSDELLPDLPTNSIAIDPLHPDHVYVGNDLGVYLSEDAGATWSPWVDGLPEATLVAHLNVSPANRKLRVATHGRGVYERDLAFDASTHTTEIEAAIARMLISPNPANDHIRIDLELQDEINGELALFDVHGRRISIVHQGHLRAGTHQFSWRSRASKNDLTPGTYFVRLLSAKGVYSQPVFVQ